MESEMKSDSLVADAMDLHRKIRQTYIIFSCPTFPSLPCAMFMIQKNYKKQLMRSLSSFHPFNDLS